MIDIQSASNVSDEALREAMQAAFSDYAVPLRLNAEAFAFMMRQRGLDRSSSRVALQDGKVIAIWLTAVRGSQAYLISSGTRPAFRSRGIARALALASVQVLQDHGIASFQTEVLRSNETAATLYYSLGMTVTRELSCYLLEPKKNTSPLPAMFGTTRWRDIADDAAALRDWQPTWQNNDSALHAIADKVACLASFDQFGLAGYAAADPKSGTVFQIAVRPDRRRKGLGTALLRHMASDAERKALRLLNIQANDGGFHAFMTANGATETEGQYHLAMSL